MSDVVIDTVWLAEHLNDPEVRLVDVRAPHLYKYAHIPTAVNLSALFLTGPDNGGPADQQLATILGRLGIANNAYIVAYDDGASPAAARLYWVMTYFRHERLSVLDGGIATWTSEGRPIEGGPLQSVPVSYVPPRPDSTVVATLDDVMAAINDPEVIIVDARSPEEYEGIRPTAARNGHIPGAVNVDWSYNLREADGVVRLRSDDELRELYMEAGVDPAKRVIVHCQTGNRASESFVVLKKLGYSRVQHYGRGWQEWGNRFDVPVEES